MMQSRVTPPKYFERYLPLFVFFFRFFVVSCFRVVRVAASRIMTRVELELTYVFLREESKSAIRIAFGVRELDLYTFLKNMYEGHCGGLRARTIRR
jgi:hypothetical protein